MDAAALDELRRNLTASGLEVFECMFRGELDAAGERVFASFAATASQLGAEGIRMGGDLATLKRAAQLAASTGTRILYQMHTGGPFETVAAAAQSIQEIDEPNFGVMPEPANLVMAGEQFTERMFEPLCGRVFGVHVQTLVVGPDAANVLRLSDGTEVRYERVPYEENDQTDFATFFAALRHIGFEGFVNELEPCQPVEELEDTVARAAVFLKGLIS